MDSNKSKSDLKWRYKMIVVYMLRFNFDDDNDKEFPLDIVQLIVNVFLYSKVKFLKFSTKFKNKAVELSDDDKCAKCWDKNSSTPHVIVECDPVKSGVHVWRVRV